MILNLSSFWYTIEKTKGASDPNDLILQSNQTNQFDQKKTLSELLKFWTFEVVEWCLQASTSNIWYWVPSGVKWGEVLLLLFWKEIHQVETKREVSFWQPAVGPVPVPELGGLEEQGRLIVEEPHNSNFPPFGPDPPARPHQRVPHQHLACPCKRLFNPS